MGIHFHAVSAIVKTVRGSGPARRAAKKAPRQKSPWSEVIILPLNNSNFLADAKVLRKRLTYISSLERSLKKADTPFEERLFFNGVKMAFQALRHNGLIAKSASKSLPSTKSRRKLAGLLIGIMEKALKNRISELVELKKVKIKDLPPTNVSKKAPLPPARKALGSLDYLKLIRELPRK